MTATSMTATVASIATTIPNATSVIATSALELMEAINKQGGVPSTNTVNEFLETVADLANMTAADDSRVLLSALDDVVRLSLQRLAQTDTHDSEKSPPTSTDAMFNATGVDNDINVQSDAV